MHGTNATVVSKCTGAHQKFNYPPFAARSQRVRVDPRSGNSKRQLELDQALPTVQAALDRGEDVVVHCMQSFHRGPVVAAAVYKRLTGKSAWVHALYLTN